MNRSWLALMMGNSRLHWGWFLDSRLCQTWDTPHIDAQAIATLFTPPSPAQAIPAIPHDLLSLLLQPKLPLWIASVVPSQTALWQVHPQAQVITLEQIPIQRLYSSLGIDRALAAWGAIQKLGAPVLVIDSGTALTFTGVDEQLQLVGGAIVAGLQTQMRSLAQNTALLPAIDPQPDVLPDRWATTTPDAIRSGVIYTMLATIRDYGEAWLARFPEGIIALTGGDCEILMAHLQHQCPAIAAHLKVEPHLIFGGMRRVVENLSLPSRQNPTC
jgi:type III pantothenate kinase